MSPEGVVLGADSTSSLMTQPGIFHFFNHNQKLFELGEGSSIGVLTWGLGGLSSASHRSLLGQLADDVKLNHPVNLDDIAARWCALFGPAYNGDPLIIQLTAVWTALGQKTPFVAPSAQPQPSAAVPAARTQEEENTYARLSEVLTVGFCFAGHMTSDHTPNAAYMLFGPSHPVPTPTSIPMHSYAFWGVPNMIKRLIWGYDEQLVSSILGSGKWSGTQAELHALLETRKLDHAVLPLRDAVDFVNTCIYSTIKAMKFSNQAQVCGGPIEIAVISTDRNFRWVRHKAWNAAILEGEDTRHDRTQP